MLANGNIVELRPTDGRKSFYGKARVIEENGTKTLYSYETAVCRINADGKFERLWYDEVEDSRGRVRRGYSATTMRHINSFCKTYGINGGGKKWWDNL